MTDSGKNTELLFEEIYKLVKNRDFANAYQKLDSEQLKADDDRVKSFKAFLNYCEFVKFESKDKSIKTLRDLSIANSPYATFFLASAYLIPGIYKSLNAAIPESIQLLENLYNQKFSKSFLLYANLLIHTGKYEQAWEVLREAESNRSTPISEIIKLKLVFIGKTNKKIDQLPKIFRECIDQYNSGNHSVCSSYASFLLDKNGQFFDPSLGIRVIEEGSLQNENSCLMLKAKLLISHSGYIKRDANRAVTILKEIIKNDKYDQGSRLLLSQIYLQTEEYKNSGYEKEVVKLLSDSFWYCDLGSINLYLATIQKYHLYDEKNYVKALEMKAKLEGKNSKLSLKLFKILLFLSKPIGAAWHIIVLIISFVLAFILATLRIIPYYLSVFIRRIFK